MNKKFLKSINLLTEKSLNILQKSNNYHGIKR